MQKYKHTVEVKILRKKILFGKGKKFVCVLNNKTERKKKLSPEDG